MQNLLILNLRRQHTDALAKEIEHAGMRLHASPFWRGTVACTGTEFCKLALTETKGFAQWLVEQLEERMRGPSHLQFPWLLRATMRSPLRSPAHVEGTQGFLPQPGKDLERPSSTRLKVRVPSHGSGAMTRSPSPLAWRPDFPGAPREAH